MKIASRTAIKGLDATFDRIWIGAAGRFQEMETWTLKTRVLGLNHCNTGW